MPYRITRLRSIVYRIIDALSFNAKIRDLADLLNRKVEHSEEATAEMLSHPGGFTRSFRKRRMGIAESYIRIARQLGKANYCQRLHALKMLVELSLHAKTVSMPLNTARVQIEIMKETIKNLENKRKQMEMIADFSLASYGHEAVIRRFLRELKRVEVPEKGVSLRKLGLGWDSHVHDNVSEGRKTPSQLILDAFIKGLSRVTLAYYDIPHKDIVFEAMEAGNIMGIDVSVAVEFSVGPRRRRKHFIYVPPVGNHTEFTAFFESRCDRLSRFVMGLEENRENRRRTIIAILENFNQTHLIRLNEGYSEGSIFALSPLRFEDLEKIVPHGQYSRNHLSELLYTKFKISLKKRVLILKVQYEVAIRLFRQGKMTEWELQQIEKTYHDTREQYTALTPDELGSAYFSGKNIVDYDSAFVSEQDVLPGLKAAGGEIVYIRPLEHGLADAVSTVVNAHSYITEIELINMRDSVMRNPSEIICLSRFIDLINNRDLSDLKKFLNSWRIYTVDPDMLDKAYHFYHQNPLVPVAGSASTGWKPHIPGMGFIRKSDIPRKSRRHFIKSHYRLPSEAAVLITTRGKGSDKEEDNSPEHEIFSLGKSGRFKPNLVGDEERFERIGFGRMWQYLNPAIKNLIRVAIGLIPSYLWFGPVYTAVWFGITFFRNMFVDVVSASGTRPGNWYYKDINFDNTAQSLFWTGFSVPLLGMVKQQFDHICPFPLESIFFEWSKFFFLCIANGAYIAAHNKIRQFDSRIIRGNFFRSLLAWPFASMFAPIGNFMGVPSIVQAKFWSDMVAAIIEGTGKFRQQIVLRKRDFLEILPMLGSEDKAVQLTAMLDILYIWAKRQQGRACLYRILTDRRSDFSFLRLRKRKTAEKESSEYVELLIQMFEPERAQFELSNFILERYKSHEEIVLIELVQWHLAAFHLWVRKLKKRVRSLSVSKSS